MWLIRTVIQSRVGVNPFVLHFDKSVFGEDAEEFNPDRWVRPEAKEMNSCMFQVGISRSL